MASPHQGRISILVFILVKKYIDIYTHTYCLKSILTLDMGCLLITGFPSEVNSSVTYVPKRQMIKHSQECPLSSLGRDPQPTQSSPQESEVICPRSKRLIKNKKRWRSLWMQNVLSRFSCVQLFATLWTVACQASLSTGFSRQECWSGLPCLPPRDLPNPRTEPASPASPILQADSLPLSHCEI